MGVEHMKHIGALLLKFVLTSVILAIFLLAFTSLTYGSIFTIALTITVLSYVIGDIWILPRADNMIATVADFGLSFVMLLLFNLIYTGAVIPFYTALFASLALGLGEWFFHKFMARSIIQEHSKIE
jgi:hypothetical protein